jgi:hypothetical protein
MRPERRTKMAKKKSEAELRIDRLKKYAKKTKRSPADIALDISMRGIRRISYLQVYRWLNKLSMPHKGNADELEAFLTERGF